MNSPFKGLASRYTEIEVSGQKIKVKPKVKHAEAFMTLKKEMTEQDVARVSEILVDMIHSANPDESKEDIEAFVAMHYGELMQQIAVLYGFATKKELEEMRKKAIGQ